MIWLPAHDVAHSPLLKIPLLVASTGLAHIALTPPTPAASKEEQAKYKGGQDVLSKWTLLRVAGVGYKTIYWFNVVAESAVILSTQLPATFGTEALPYLVRNPLYRADDIRITPSWFTGFALLAGGALLRLSCYRSLGEFFTWQMTVKKGQKLVTTGPYGFVRHPAYLGSWMIGLGTVAMHFSPGGWFHECVGTDSVWSKAFIAFWSVWMLSVPVILSKRAKVEDEALKEEFGEEWNAYAQKTRYRLIPFIY